MTKEKKLFSLCEQKSFDYECMFLIQQDIIKEYRELVKELKKEIQILQNEKIKENIEKINIILLT